MHGLYAAQSAPAARVAIFASVCNTHMQMHKWDGFEGIYVNNGTSWPEGELTLALTLTPTPTPTPTPTLALARTLILSLSLTLTRPLPHAGLHAHEAHQGKGVLQHACMLGWALTPGWHIP